MSGGGGGEGSGDKPPYPLDFLMLCFLLEYEGFVYHLTIKCSG